MCSALNALQKQHLGLYSSLIACIRLDATLGSTLEALSVHLHRLLGARSPLLASCALFLPAVMAAVLDQIARSLAAPDDQRRLVALATLVAVIQNGLDISRSESLMAITQQAASLTSVDALRVSAFSKTSTAEPVPTAA